MENIIRYLSINTVDCNLPDRIITKGKPISIYFCHLRNKWYGGMQQYPMDETSIKVLLDGIESGNSYDWPIHAAVNVEYQVNITISDISTLYTEDAMTERGIHAIHMYNEFDQIVCYIGYHYKGSFDGLETYVTDSNNITKIIIEFNLYKSKRWIKDG